MSAQVVLPTKLSQPQSRVSTGTGVSQKPTTPVITRKTAVNGNPPRFTRFRSPKKPEIQVDKNELKQKLTPLQYKVTQEKFTERPFSGEYVRLNDKGIYCCVVCGEEIFSSEAKYDSGCGWPAFFNSIDSEKLILQTDLSHVGGNLLLLALNQDLARTEVTCAKCGAHLGHVFDDGPKPTGKRYCVNSASLKFKKSNGEEVICDIPFNNGSCCFRSPTRTSLPSLSSPPPLPAPPPQPKPTIVIEKENNKITENNKNNKESKKPVQNSFAKPLLSPKPSLEIQLRQNSQQDMKHNLKTKSLSPTRRTDIQPSTTTIPSMPIYSSSHAKRVQMNREDFFKSTTSTTPGVTTNNYNNNNHHTNKTNTKNNDSEKKTTMTTSTTMEGTNNLNNINSQNASSLSSSTSNKPVLNRIKRLSNLFNGDNNNEDNCGGSNLKNDYNNNNKSYLINNTNNKYSDVKSRYLDHLDSLSKKSVIKHTFGPKKSNTVSNTTPSKPITNDSVLESDL